MLFAKSNVSLTCIWYLNHFFSLKAPISCLNNNNGDDDNVRFHLQGRSVRNMQVAAVASNNLSVISLFYRPHDRSFLNVDEWLLFLEVYSSVEHSVKWRQHRSKSVKCHKKAATVTLKSVGGVSAAARRRRRRRSMPKWTEGEMSALSSCSLLLCIFKRGLACRSFVLVKCSQGSRWSKSRKTNKLWNRH